MALGDRLRLLRATDLLNLEVEVGNLQVAAAGDVLEPVDPQAPGILVVHFPSQHLAEEAFFVFADHADPAGPPPVRTVAAAPSRLAFEVPAGQSVPLTVDALLAWDGWRPRLADNADDPTAPPSVPPDDVTAVEFPWRMLLSPGSAGRWAHRTQPGEAGGRVELWHTSLRDAAAAPDPGAPAPGLPIRDVGATPAGPVRAVASRTVPDQFLTSLDQRTVDDVVRLTADPMAPRNVRGLPFPLWLVRLARLRGWRWHPVPLSADRFQLSALGASARFRGRWDFPGPDAPVDQATLTGTYGIPAVSLEAYDHIAGGGRDQFVRIVRKGFIHHGHRASIISVTERRFEPRQIGTGIDPSTGDVIGVFGNDAYLRRWVEIVFVQPELDYGELAGAYDAGGREMPLRRLRLVTRRTPPIDLDPSLAELEARARAQVGNDETAVQQETQRLLAESLTGPFWVRVGGRDFEISAVGTDWSGAPVSMTSPVMFVPYESASNADAVRTVFAQGSPARRTTDVHRQPVTVADPSGQPPGSTRVPVVDLTFTLQAVAAGEVAALPAAYQPRWVFATVGATVALQAVEQLTGGAGTSAVTFHADYLAAGLGNGNPGGRFLRLGTGVQVAFGGEQGGGLARPSSTVDVVSSTAGVVADAFVPGPVPVASMAALFGNAKLFGSVRLSDVLDAPTLTAADFQRAGSDLEAVLAAPGQRMPIPVLRTRRIPGGTEIRYVWKPPLHDFGPFRLGPDTVLLLDARKLVADDGRSLGGEVVGRLQAFSLNFFDVAEVRLDRLEFRAVEGRKTDLTAEGFDLRFLGPLTFINTLRDILPANGFSDPPAVTINTSGIKAGYSLAVPSLGVGLFSLQNLSLGAELAVPFDDHPAAVRFSVSERHSPFLVTVMIFGGGGFFAMAVSAKGVEQIEAAIEFGGNISLNLGVASGGVYVMAGVYFGRTGDVCTLTGYFRCGGYLSVLGLISISIEFYLAFTYRDKGGGHSEIWGQASVSVTVEIAFFSKTVSLSVEKRLAGAAGDPSFVDALDVADWQEYCDAFA